MVIPTRNIGILSIVFNFIPSVMNESAYIEIYIIREPSKKAKYTVFYSYLQILIFWIESYTQLVTCWSSSTRTKSSQSICLQYLYGFQKCIDVTSITKLPPWTKYFVIKVHSNQCS